MYSDPSEMAREGTRSEQVYPKTWWMPGKAMQRGNLRVDMGDPLTPGFPSLSEYECGNGLYGLAFVSAHNNISLLLNYPVNIHKCTYVHSTVCIRLCLL